MRSYNIDSATAFFQNNIMNLIIFKHVVFIISLLLSSIILTSGQFRADFFHKVSGRDLLMNRDCGLYTMNSNTDASSARKCAARCMQATGDCYHYEFFSKDYLCLMCVCNPRCDFTDDNLAPFITSIPKGGRLYEKHAMKPTSRPCSCMDILKSGAEKSGVYSLNLKNAGCKSWDLTVYCDMQTCGGGWTVFQRRQDGSVSFARSWTEYKLGFGDKKAEFWLGNEILTTMTSKGCYRLRLDLESFDGERRYAEYENFKVGSEAENYKLTIGMYSGTAGDGGNGLSHHNGMNFTTIDRDNDESEGNCAQRFGGGGGFWYKYCDRVSPNGNYSETEVIDDHGITWDAWMADVALKKVEMKLRLRNFS